MSKNYLNIPSELQTLKDEILSFHHVNRTCISTTKRCRFSTVKRNAYVRMM